MRRNKHARWVSTKPAVPVSLFRRPIRKGVAAEWGWLGPIPFHLFRQVVAGCSAECGGMAEWNREIYPLRPFGAGLQDQKSKGAPS